MISVLQGNHFANVELQFLVFSSIIFDYKINVETSEKS